MKCQICEGRGFIEYNHGLLQVQCSFCSGTGEMPEDVITQAAQDQPTEVIDANSEFGGLQPDKPARRKYTRKSTKPRKRAKGL